MASLPDLLKTLVDVNGSDLHLTTQTPPQIRVHGKLQTLDLPVLGPAETKSLEYIHQHKGCLVNQREVHADTHGFANALRAALREDPDIVLIGELRDLETIESALRIA